MTGGLKGGRIGFADRAGRATPRAAARLGHSATIDLRGRDRFYGRDPTRFAPKFRDINIASLPPFHPAANTAEG